MFLLLPPAGIDYHKAKMEHTDRLITTELMRRVSESVWSSQVSPDGSSRVCRACVLYLPDVEENSLESQFCADRVGRLLNTLLSLLLLFLNSLDFILSSFSLLSHGAGLHRRTGGPPPQTDGIKGA